MTVHVGGDENLPCNPEREKNKSKVLFEKKKEK